jgi:hypothetical protein
MKTMNLKRLLLLLSLGLPLQLAVADDVPKPFALARYQGMMDRSPFAVATALAAPAATPNFAKDLYIANAAREKDESFVTLASMVDKNFKKYLSTSAPVDGYSIASIEWSEKVGATKVTIAKDDQLATLSFNEALLRSPAGGAPGQNPPAPMTDKQAADRVPIQSSVPVVPGAPKPMPVPALPTPPPRVRGVIPRNPSSPKDSAAAPAPPQPQL